MCPLCAVCARPVAVRGSRCPVCEAEGLEPGDAAYFDNPIDAIGYAEKRADWPHFRVKHIQDHVYICYTTG